MDLDAELMALDEAGAKLRLMLLVSNATSLVSALDGDTTTAHWRTVYKAAPPSGQEFGVTMSGQDRAAFKSNMEDVPNALAFVKSVLRLE